MKNAQVETSAQVELRVQHTDGQLVVLIIRGRWDAHANISRYTITVMVPSNTRETGWEVCNRWDGESETAAAEWLAPHLPIDADAMTCDELSDAVAERAHFALDVTTSITNTVRSTFSIYGRPAVRS